MKVPHLPALRWGTPYQSLDETTLKHVGSGDAVGRLSIVNGGIIRRDALQAPSREEIFDGLTSQELVRMCERAAHFFMKAPLPAGREGEMQTVEQYVTQLSSTTGLPENLCRINMSKIESVLVKMETVLTGLTRGLPLDIFDTAATQADGLDICFYPAAKSLAVILPSNSPGVNSLWLPALAMRIPVLLKPGREDPWTPLRLIQALISAGMPSKAFCFYPTTHEGSEEVVRAGGKVVVFGGDATVKKYEGNLRVQCHGTGRSKILVGADQAGNYRKFLDISEHSITANGGRSCINASAILTPSQIDDFAEALAKRLAAYEALPLAHAEAKLAGFSKPEVAEAINERLDEALAEGGAVDVTAQFRQGPRLVRVDGMSYLLPTLVKCESPDHPLANTEYPFPFCAIVEVPQEGMIDVIGPTLVATVVSDDADWIQDLMLCPLIDRLNVGPISTMTVQWEQPHEGNLFEFLFMRRALQRDAGRATVALAR